MSRCKKKIIIVNDMLVGGGVEKLLYDLVWAWHDKYDITVWTLQRCNDYKTILPDNVKYASSSSQKVISSEVFLARKYNGFLKRLGQYKLNKKCKGYDVAIALKDGLPTLMVSKLNVPRKLAWNHTDYNSYYYTQGVFGSPENERETLKKFYKIVCVSEGIRKGICDIVGDPGNLIVCYNPLDTKDILKKSEEKVDDIDSLDLPKEAQPIRFVTVGRINYQKGYGLLLEACHMLDLDGLKYEVIVVGGKEEWEDEFYRLERMRKRLDTRNVKFIGARNNPYKYIRCADWFVSSSIFEGFSYVSQEAALLGVPLILTDCSGVRELLGDSEYGIVTERSVYGIYEAMKRVIINRKLHDHYKDKIIERKSFITYEERLNEIEKLL